VETIQHVFGRQLVCLHSGQTLNRKEVKPKQSYEENRRYANRGFAASQVKNK